MKPNVNHSFQNLDVKFGLDSCLCIYLQLSRLAPALLSILAWSSFTYFLRHFRWFVFLLLFIDETKLYISHMKKSLKGILWLWKYLLGVGYFRMGAGYRYIGPVRVWVWCRRVGSSSGMKKGCQSGFRCENVYLCRALVDRRVNCALSSVSIWLTVDCIVVSVHSIMSVRFVWILSPSQNVMRCSCNLWPYESVILWWERQCERKKRSYLSLEVYAWDIWLRVHHAWRSSLLGRDLLSSSMQKRMNNMEEEKQKRRRDRTDKCILSLSGWFWSWVLGKLSSDGGEHRHNVITSYSTSITYYTLNYNHYSLTIYTLSLYKFHLNISFNWLTSLTMHISKPFLCVFKFLFIKKKLFFINFFLEKKIIFTIYKYAKYLFIG
jgi:hypothetical protein